MEVYHVDVRAYRLDAPDPDEGEAAFLAVLAAQLPPTARTSKRMSPALRWSDESYLLAQVDYDIRAFMWGFSEDARKGVNKPERIKGPIDVEEATRQVEATRFDLVDSVLSAAGIDPRGPVGRKGMEDGE